MWKGFSFLLVILLVCGTALGEHKWTTQYPPGTYGFASGISGDWFYVWGGETAISRLTNDLRRYNLKTKTWEYVPQSGSIPSPRRFTSHVVVNNQLIMFGGEGGTPFVETNPTFFTETWVLDLSTHTWSQKTGTSPPRRSSSMAALAPDRGSFVIYGGRIKEFDYYDLWEYNYGSHTWKEIEQEELESADPRFQVNPPGSSFKATGGGRSFHYFCYDSKHKNFWIHGGGRFMEGQGNREGPILADTRKLEIKANGKARWIAAWPQGDDKEKVPPKYGGSCMSKDGALYIFGGKWITERSSFVEKFTFVPAFNAPHSTYQSVSPGADTPEPRVFAGGHDYQGNFLIFAGEGVDNYRDFRTLNTGSLTWDTDYKSYAHAREGHCSVLANGKIYSFGGHYGRVTEPNGEMVIYNTGSNTWSTGTSGSARHSHLCVGGGGKMYVYGGSTDGTNALADTLIYTLDGGWSTASGGPPAGRVGVTLVYNSDKDTVYLFGGASAFTQNLEWYDDLYELSGSSWTKLEYNLVASMTQGPTGRSWASGIYDPGSKMMFVYGGEGNPGPLTTTVHYETTSNTWVHDDPQGPASTLGAQSVWTSNNQWLLYGGVTRGSQFASQHIYQFDTASRIWLKKLAIGGITQPEGRKYHSATMSGNTMYAYGGRTDSGTTDHFVHKFQFDPSVTPTTAGPPTTGSTPTTGGTGLPTTGGTTPTTGGTTPTTGGTTPTTGGPTPTTGRTTPTTGGTTPNTGGPTPTTGGSTPTTGGSTSTTGGSSPSTTTTGVTTPDESVASSMTNLVFTVIMAVVLVAFLH